MSKQKRRRSLFWAILMPQFLVLLLLVLVLTASMPASGMGDNIVRNYQNVIALQTDNQGEHLEAYFGDNRVELTAFSREIAASVQQKLDAGTLTVDKLDNDSKTYEQILRGAANEMISMIYSHHAAGAYIILNTKNVGGGVELPCLHLRDESTTTVRSGKDGLRILCAPEKVRNGLNIKEANGCLEMFVTGTPAEQPYFYETYLPAYRSGVVVNSVRYGYWTLTPCKINGGERQVMSYSEPIILDDGKIIGVVGVEFLVDYIAHYLPAGALLESENSSFIIATSYNGAYRELTEVVNGGKNILDTKDGEPFKLDTLQIGGYSLTTESSVFYADTYPLKMYGADSLRGNQKWFLVGAVGMNEMFSYAEGMTRAIMLAVGIVLLVGLVSAITVSRRLARPISVLVQEVYDAKKAAVTFTDTGIEEVDRLSVAYRELMQETLDTSTKFLRIMELASVDLAGYEWREGSDSFYVTDNFFPMLGMEDTDPATLTVEQFRDILDDIRKTLGASITLDGSRIYCISKNGKVRYVRAESSQDGDRNVGLLEDVTRTTLERIRIEHERDYDVLTGLYNRRAFYNRAGQLFTGKEDILCSALMVMDLDNLKGTNDRFGHDWGDRYLRQTAQCILENAPHNALCARISGDELYVLFHGYTDRRKLRGDIEKLLKAVRETQLHLPNGETMTLSVSGGLALYPDDSTNLSELIKYADFAMYHAKANKKGRVLGFDADEYAKNEMFMRGRGELRKLIEEENVSYHFQPIFSAVTARPAAYEALMRVDMPSIKSPDVVLRLAAAEGSQYQIERITMFKASETYRSLLKNGQVADDAMLFINSQPDQCLNDTDAQGFHERFADIQSRIVLEITEDEYLGLEMLEAKRRYPGFSGNFALDDYGSGYNGEKNLLLLQPRFVKVDVVFIRGIDTNPDRQQLVSSLVTYAHGRGMQVVAEGIETAEELKKVLELGVDLFQGYFLARPAAVPAPIAPQAEEIIKSFRRD